MVESNKILTVSYGTFSCTLEGFEDSFGTMKSIAEYFRDLAAGDRYFGAEPPTPDADMLTRIAEKEIARRVEARMESSGLVLRATGAIGSDAADDAPRAAAPRPPMPPAARPKAAPAPVAVPVDDYEDAEDFDTEATALVTKDIDGPDASQLAASGPEMAPPPQVADPAPPRRTIRIEPKQPPAHPDPESVAAKLQRIRAVVGKASTGVMADAAADYVEDLNLSDDLSSDAADEAVLSSLMNDAEPAPAPVRPTPAEALAEDVDLAVIRSVTAIGAEGTDDLAGDDAETDAELDAEMDEDFEEDLSDFDDDDLAEDDDYSDDDFAPETEAEGLVAEEAPAPVLARAIRMKREAYDEAIAKGTLVEDADSDDDADDDLADLDGIEDLEHFADVAEDGALDHDDEAELMQDLAAVEREIAQASAQTTDRFDIGGEGADTLDASLFERDAEDEGAAEDHAPVRPGRAMLDREPEADERGFDRLMSKADEELNEPESNRRRAAIAQLKAAVAATEAARRMGEEGNDDEAEEEVFRDDLSQVVRPRRAEVAERRTERPRPAPLKLVASQRIDMPRPAGASVEPSRPVVPVRPRRVAVDEAAAPSTAPTRASGTSFAEFAEKVGARELGDLLEAAAAYTSFVEGSEDFSRPQLMKIVREASGEDFSREDGLRSFGTLLRQGRISKVSNGRFQVSDQTRYRPEPRAARG